MKFNSILNSFCFIISIAFLGSTPMGIYAQVVLDGVNIKVESSTAIYLDGIGLTNKTNGIDGSIDNEGDIYIEGDWNNNALAGTVFVNLNALGNVHFTGPNAQALGGTQPTHFESLTINNSSATGVTLDEPIEVNQALTMVDGIAFTDATNLITIVDGGSSNDGNSGSFVDGPIRKIGNTDFLFPTGDGTIWAPIEVTSIAGGASTDEYTSEYFDASAPFPNNLPASGINNVSLIEYWDISHTGSATSTDVTLYWKDAVRSDILDLTGGDLLVVRYNTGISEWEVRGSSICAGSTVGVGGTGCVTGNFTSFSYVTFGSISGVNPLPVTWLSFTGKQINQYVYLFWETVTEINNDYFTIERSVNGMDFEAIGVIPGSGNSNLTVAYDFYDERPIIGLSYYRIKQTDSDGKNDYSKIIALEYDPFRDSSFDEPEVMIYPNPAKGDVLHINVKAPFQNNEVEVSIIDGEGKVYYLDNLEMPNNQFDIPIERDLLRRGLYILTIKNQSIVHTGRFVIH